MTVASVRDPERHASVISTPAARVEAGRAGPRRPVGKAGWGTAPARDSRRSRLPGPARRVAQAGCSTQSPIGHDQADFLGKRDEIVGRQHAALGWRQRSNASNPHLRERRHNGLVEQLELPPRAPGAGRSQGPGAPACVGPSRTRNTGRPRVLIWRGKGHIGAADQTSASPRSAAPGDADADADND